MPGWITDKPDGSRAVWEVEGESHAEARIMLKLWAA